MSRKPPPHTCVVCGRTTSNEDANVCQLCATPFDDGYFDDRYQKICPHCNQIQPMFSVFCQYCGKPFYLNVKNIVTQIGNKILGGIIMATFKRIGFSIFFLIIGIIALLFSLITFPLIMGWIAIICTIGAGLMVLGGLLGIISGFIPTGKKFKTAADPTSKALSWTGFTIFVLTLLVIGCIALAGTFNQQLNNQVPTNPSPTTAPTSTATIAPTAPAPTATIAVVDPALEHGTYPQTQIGHPNFYVETDIKSTYKWTFEVKTNEIGIVGGVTVDGVGGGVYRAYAPGTYTVTVSNGFVLTIQKDWAQNEFLFRVGQAVKYNWAYGTVDYGPLLRPTK